MSMYESLRRDKIKGESHRFYAARKMKLALAKSAVLRIHEELALRPDAEEFETPILKPEPFAMDILKYAPEEVSRRIDIGRTVTLFLNTEVEPPMLRITLADKIDDSAQ